MSFLTRTTAAVRTAVRKVSSTPEVPEYQGRHAARYAVVEAEQPGRRAARPAPRHAKQTV